MDKLIQTKSEKTMETNSPMQNEESPNLTSEAIKIIEQLDRLYYEKPAGYHAFLAICQSSTKLTSFIQPTQINRPGSE
ncbi:hypothetical protein I2I11_20145 [Pontibacter sp. 172403-2]|uniref:hypothetical protein n=1 Tax=Pontibacter rufus TaxID=2791028 RepID=UPI0018B006F0|nr:hypothetical protein [Pontibacter sp. 172403-2]MBF9255621.1 hypothetical protein [Pontibacter sp. 172403-2]